jgi:uncharacterized RDD family membrane protein YckC
MRKCSYCGKEYSDDVPFCAVDQQPLGSTTLVSLETIAHQDKSPYAGYGIRLLARIIDTFVGLLIGFGAGIFGGIAIVILNHNGIIATGWQNRIHGLHLSTLGLSLLGDIAYHFFCEGIHGATLGKLCCGLRVVSEDGQPSNLKGALIRTLAFYIDGLFFGLVGYNSMQKSPSNQRYGDVWGKTAVVSIKQTVAESQRTPTHFIIGLLIGAGCWFVMLAIGLILKAF